MTNLSRLVRTGILAVLSVAVFACGQTDSADNSDALQAQAYLDVADLYRTQGQFRASLIEAQNAIQADPDSTEAGKLMARVYMDLGDINAASQIMDQLRVSTPEDSEVQLLLAETNLYRGNFTETLSILRSSEFVSVPQQIQALWLEANALARMDELLVAQEALNAALAIDPNHTPSLTTLSILEYQTGNEFGSQEILERAIASNPDDLDLLIWRGQFAVLQEDYATAEEAYFRALDIMSGFDTMTAKRLSVLQSIIIPLQMQQKDEEALRYSQIIAESPQGQLQNSFADAVALFQEGNFIEAASTIESILESAPNHTGSNILRGLSQYALGEYESAAQSLQGLVDAESATPEVIRALAATHLRLNQPERALSVLQEARTNYPEDSSIPAMMGVGYQEIGDIQQSIASFNDALSLLPDSVQLHFAIAGAYFLDQNSELAISHLEQAIEIDPNFAQAKVTLVDYYLSQGESERALSEIQQWLNTDSTSANDYMLLGRVEYQNGNRDTARDAFTTVLENNPESIEPRLLLARLDIDENDYESALEHLEAVLENNPLQSQAISGILTVGDLSDSSENGIARIEELISEQTTAFQPPLVLSLYFLSKSDLEAARFHAETAYARAVNSDTTNTLLDILNRQIAAFRSVNNLQDAREISNQALELAPTHIPSLIMAAGIESDAGNYSEASEYIDQIKDAQPENSTIGFQVEGDFLIAQDRREEAHTALKQAWDAQPESNLGFRIHQNLIALSRANEAHQFLEEWEMEIPGDSNANLLIGMSHQERGEDSQAVERYEITLETAPDNIVALNNLAWLYQDDNPTRAMELAQRAADLSPDNADILDTYGWILLKNDNKDLAIEMLERASELAPESASIAEHLDLARQ